MTKVSRECLGSMVKDRHLASFSAVVVLIVLLFLSVETKLQKILVRIAVA